MNWSLNDLLMMLEDTDQDSETIAATYVEATRHLIKMEKELQTLRPIAKAIKTLAIEAVGINNGQ